MSKQHKTYQKVDSIFYSLGMPVQDWIEEHGGQFPQFRIALSVAGEPWAWFEVWIERLPSNSYVVNLSTASIVDPDADILDRFTEETLEDAVQRLGTSVGVVISHGIPAMVEKLIGPDIDAGQLCMMVDYCPILTPLGASSHDGGSGYTREENRGE